MVYWAGLTSFLRRSQPEIATRVSNLEANTVSRQSIVKFHRQRPTPSNAVIHALGRARYVLNIARYLWSVIAPFRSVYAKTQRLLIQQPPDLSQTDATACHIKSLAKVYLPTWTQRYLYDDAMIARCHTPNRTVERPSLSRQFAIKPFSSRSIPSARPSGWAPGGSSTKLAKLQGDSFEPPL